MKTIQKSGAVKRGKRAQTSNVNKIPAHSIIYNNLIKPVKKVVPILKVKPTVRPVQQNPEPAPRGNIEIIELDLPIEEALQQRVLAAREEVQAYNRNADSMELDSSVNSDTDTTTENPNIDSDSDIEIVSVVDRQV